MFILQYSIVKKVDGKYLQFYSTLTKTLIHEQQNVRNGKIEELKSLKYIVNGDSQYMYLTFVSTSQAELDTIKLFIDKIMRNISYYDEKYVLIQQGKLRIV